MPNEERQGIIAQLAYQYKEHIAKLRDLHIQKIHHHAEAVEKIKAIARAESNEHQLKNVMTEDQALYAGSMHSNEAICLTFGKRLWLNLARIHMKMSKISLDTAAHMYVNPFDWKNGTRQNFIGQHLRKGVDNVISKQNRNKLAEKQEICNLAHRDMCICAKIYCNHFGDGKEQLAEVHSRRRTCSSQHADIEKAFDLLEEEDVIDQLTFEPMTMGQCRDRLEEMTPRSICVNTSGDTYNFIMSEIYPAAGRIVEKCFAQRNTPVPIALVNMVMELQKCPTHQIRGKSSFSEDPIAWEKGEEVFTELRNSDVSTTRAEAEDAAADFPLPTDERSVAQPARSLLPAPMRRTSRNSRRPHTTYSSDALEPSEPVLPAPMRRIPRNPRSPNVTSSTVIPSPPEHVLPAPMRRTPRASGIPNITYSSDIQASSEPVEPPSYTSGIPESSSETQRTTRTDWSDVPVPPYSQTNDNEDFPMSSVAVQVLRRRMPVPAYSEEESSP